MSTGGWELPECSPCTLRGKGRNSCKLNILFISILHLDAACTLSLAAVSGRDGVVLAVGDRPAEVEAEPVLEGELVRPAPGGEVAGAVDFIGGGVGVRRARVAVAAILGVEKVWKTFGK